MADTVNPVGVGSRHTSLAWAKLLALLNLAVASCGLLIISPWLSDSETPNVVTGELAVFSSWWPWLPIRGIDTNPTVTGATWVGPYIAGPRVARRCGDRQRKFEAIAVMAGVDLLVQLTTCVRRVSESGYCGRRSRSPSLRSIRHAWLTDTITAIHTASCGTYGACRVNAELTLGCASWSVTGRQSCIRYPEGAVLM